LLKLDVKHPQDDGRGVLAELLLAMTLSVAEHVCAGLSNDVHQLAIELASYTFATCEDL